mgnify:CR=1 FL=1
MFKTIKKSLFTLSLLSLSLVVQAESAVESLSPELRSLLSKEMLAIQKGMQSILPAYVSGNNQEVAHIAHNIKSSFVMKQNITKAQKHELQQKLPQSFLHLDKKFHEYAGMLEHVAEEKHTELIGFYYAKLSETCVSCHAQYATHKFTAFGKQKDDTHHH